ncbi:peptidoglycan amidohydrolase family protein [Bifidobacterium dentium]|uniref:peptidoglycan amidohydrolase family protein n=1 Tax=Bifidobacterium dentium TaxID=1689 RepID=UPI0018B0763F|nr:peptidoglycan amidohydrolase family protein [Bifidobacterium dentium]MBF9690593.1 C40 family peptidase [Bifidobacterium dentium]
MASVNTLIARMRYWCEVANMGYSWSDRWNFNPKAGNCDCSSLVIHCLREAGFDTGTAVNTANLSENLTSRGWKRLPVDGHPKAGDILLNDVNHVAVYLGGGQLAQASNSEHNSRYGTAGDQTGLETNISPYYNFPWNCYLRYESEDDMPTAQEIAEAVWNFDQNGVKCRDRLQGIDGAANTAVEKLSKTHTPAKIAEAVWTFIINDVQARDRLYGLDKIQVPRMYQILLEIKKKLGIK